MIVTIDGPAGAGKSTASKMLAERLGFQFLDTGAMYRAVTLAAMRRKIPLDDIEALSDERCVHALALAELARTIQIAFVEGEVLVDGTVVTEAIRSEKVTMNVAVIADMPEIREHLVRIQRQIAAGGNYVCEGRDQGTVVFPDAGCKFYMTASAEERAKRRVGQIEDAGQPANFDEIVRQQNERDARDENRPVGRLARAVDAIIIDSDYKTLDEVVDHMEQVVLSRMVRG